jgi:hypothetical protein
MHLSDNHSRHMCKKTFTKQDLGINGCQSLLPENMHSIEYQMSYKGAAGEAFSAHMPAYIAFIGLINGLRLRSIFSELFYLNAERQGWDNYEREGI